MFSMWYGESLCLSYDALCVLPLRVDLLLLAGRLARVLCSCVCCGWCCCLLWCCGCLLCWLRVCGCLLWLSDVAQELVYRLWDWVFVLCCSEDAVWDIGVCMLQLCCSSSSGGLQDLLCEDAVWYI